MSEEIFKIILLLSIGQGLTFSILLLFKKKGEAKANVLLAVFILLTLIPLWNDYAMNMPQEVGRVRLGLNWLYLPGFYGPLLYLYTLFYTRAAAPSRKTLLLLLLAPVIGSLI